MPNQDQESLDFTTGRNFLDLSNGDREEIKVEGNKIIRPYTSGCGNCESGGNNNARCCSCPEDHK